jgi:type II secretory pathway pseudopilin PulG
MIKRLNQESGFTLTEVVVAQVVLIIGAIAIWTTFVTGSRFNAESEDKTIAANIAQHKMEEIMNTRFRYIVEDHPVGETSFDSEPQALPYWTLNSEGEWVTALSEGRYQISYPDGEDADPLRIKVTILWYNQFDQDSTLSLETLVSMTPGRFRQ